MKIGLLFLALSTLSYAQAARGQCIPVSGTQDHPVILQYCNAAKANEELGIKLNGQGGCAEVPQQVMWGPERVGIVRRQLLYVGGFALPDCEQNQIVDALN